MPRCWRDFSVDVEMWRGGKTSLSGVPAAPGHCPSRGGILVATTMFPDSISPFNAAPIRRSLWPWPYASAVSKNVIPRSTAARSASRASLSLPPCHIPPPNPQAPKPSSLTLYPVVPNGLVLTLSPSRRFVASKPTGVRCQVSGVGGCAKRARVGHLENLARVGLPRGGAPGLTEARALPRASRAPVLRSSSPLSGTERGSGGEDRTRRGGQGVRNRTR